MLPLRVAVMLIQTLTILVSDCSRIWPGYLQHFHERFDYVRVSVNLSLLVAMDSDASDMGPYLESNDRGVCA